jgi:hypothetical protein
MRTLTGTLLVSALTLTSAEAATVAHWDFEGGIPGASMAQGGHWRCAGGARFVWQRLHHVCLG